MKKTEFQCKAHGLQVSARANLSDCIILTIENLLPERTWIGMQVKSQGLTILNNSWLKNGTRTYSAQCRNPGSLFHNNEELYDIETKGLEPSIKYGAFTKGATFEIKFLHKSVRSINFVFFHDTVYTAVKVNFQRITIEQRDKPHA